MTLALSIIALVLLASILAGLVPVLRGPQPAERMLAAQLLGTAAVAILLILSLLMEMPVLLDVALVFALLAAITLICFVVVTRREDH
ncbi:multiple resistance and pH regulation protein F [Ectothiorhodospira haloalkaliphila]|uniref:Multiple resistance and pH regulation protein F n=1 Tax=Ectothiorhodospira haloalkaliphila TaxID=421628 RepID=W8KFE5_9GAMM|nr:MULTISPECIES: monovalent cation/H+ antiporter complex subunit F [Ectothiorhodospira]AHK78509.1 multiple resistance and pH regulation protein F [Ectothiorhodospira haloalkaliphila]MCG5495893.1 monovalent cation/H+ antiporter complex subunit F [Ectothiorhodospira variabilis]MCG5498392.1 monovalent cation/H+ antiporter complex subunit F [Ectothiorhodospira variabilis]MCG5503038.1 monovalent cation/H+ antiporter complex subunit F [Ectothiorhodospira variabilis]MCG5508451.1 monovalent cation/H+ 